MAESIITEVAASPTIQESGAVVPQQKRVRKARAKEPNAQKTCGLSLERRLDLTRAAAYQLEGIATLGRGFVNHASYDETMCDAMLFTILDRVNDIASALMDVSMYADENVVVNDTACRVLNGPFGLVTMSVEEANA